MQRVTMPSTGVASAAAAGQRNDRPVEDCRDYLRTGRCKYGASCKYNHPPNVQSGGGMKTPIDPTEPLFPIRPNEPLCQYYMKHGTCKFGQACKFHHPPQTAMGGSAGSASPTPMNRRVDAATRMILNPVGTDGSSMMLQFLPQRPDEPDCIYFLKNGRCKYGATCRYHHPINGSLRHRRQEERRPSGRTSTEPAYGSKIQFLSQGGQITQGIVTDSPVAFVSIDGSQTLAPVTFIPTNVQANDQYCAPPGNTVATENASSVSSIGSSHDTSGTSLEYVAVPGNTFRRNGSFGSLNVPYEQSRLSRNRLTPSSSDGNIARRGRAASHGSANDQSNGYMDSTPSAESAWRQNRSGSFDQSRRAYEPRSPSMAGRPPPPRGPSGPRMPQQRPRQEQGDEGYAMMTSALLNMLTTPEETSAEVYSEDGTFHYPIDDDASGLIGGLSLQSQAATAVVSNLNSPYEESRWSPSWQQSDHSMEGQDIIHPYMQSHPPSQPGRAQFHTHHTSPSSEHSSGFGQYLP